jgi:hypothetical protein
MLRNVIWTRFFTKPVCWQNSDVIFEKSYLPHMISVLAEFGEFIEIWVMNPNKLSLHQLDFCSSRYSSWNSQRSTLADCEIWLWRLRFPCSFLFYFLALNVQKGMDVSFLMPLESLHFNLQSSCSAQNIDWRSNLPIISNLLLFASFIQKCLQNIKQRISRHFIYKT